MADQGVGRGPGGPPHYRRLTMLTLASKHRGWGYMMKLDLTIEGMHCGSCVRRVTMALQKVDGVERETLHVEVGSASVNFDAEKATQQEIVDAVNGIGFSAHAV
jgi:copper chaperone